MYNQDIIGGQQIKETKTNQRREAKKMRAVKHSEPGR
jgi:hypothetical protein